jgi:hypothetical protein
MNDGSIPLTRVLYALDATAADYNLKTVNVLQALFNAEQKIIIDNTKTIW